MFTNDGEVVQNKYARMKVSVSFTFNIVIIILVFIKSGNTEFSI